MKKLFLFLFIFLSACTPASVETPTPPKESSSLGTSSSPPTPLIVPTQKPTREPTATRTRLPSITPGPTATPYPTRTATLIPSDTPTFDPFLTATLPALCPVENLELVLDFNLPTNEFFFLEQPILDFLNAGGTREAAIAGYFQRETWADERYIQEKDLTGDSIPELLLSQMGKLTVFQCEDGIYGLKDLLEGTYHFTQPIIINADDLNLNGINEIVTFSGDDRTRFVDILEWNSSEFKQVNWDADLDQACSSMYGPSTFEFLDTDFNGTQELILYQEIPIWSEYIEGLPWRKETRTCTWNGTLFVLTKTEFAPPEYRFQAVQDADRAMLTGEYDRALDLYQQVIFSDQLDWWSEERSFYESGLAAGNTTLTLPAPDNAEYFYLAAYSRFRIMLLHILRGYLSDAEIVYTTLQDNFPDGQPGYKFAVMAELFWNEYQSSSDTGLACQKAIQYASTHPDSLTYLGDYYHGWQSIQYEPPDVCPFTSTP